MSFDNTVLAILIPTQLSILSGIYSNANIWMHDIQSVPIIINNQVKESQPSVLDMKFANFFGRKLIVDYSLLQNLKLDIVKRDEDEQVLLTLESSIMESAKVFDSVEVTTRDNTIRITVYASLVALWNQNGSPDFKVTKTLNLLPGVYEIEYVGQNGETTFLKKVQIDNDRVIELRDS
jgi:hypothetical protein